MEFILLVDCLSRWCHRERIFVRLLLAFEIDGPSSSHAICLPEVLVHFTLHLDQPIDVGPLLHVDGQHGLDHDAHALTVLDRNVDVGDALFVLKL